MNNYISDSDNNQRSATFSTLQTLEIIPINDKIKIGPIRFSSTTTIEDVTVVGDTMGMHVGDIVGNVTGNITGDVVGNVQGDIYGQVTGILHGEAYGDLNGDITGNVIGRLYGNTIGNLTGDVEGNITGNTSGTHTGPVNTNNLDARLITDMNANSYNVINSTTFGLTNKDAVPKIYVDSLSSNILYKEECAVATTGTLAATYNSGALTLTATSNGAIIIDTQTLSVGNRVLVKNMITTSENGIYVVSTVGDASNPYVLTRASDFDTSAKIASGMIVYITAGSANSATSFIMINTNFTTLDVDAIIWNIYIKQYNILSTKGDIYTRNGTSDTRLSVGTDGYLLSVNMTSNTGLEWRRGAHDSNMYGLANDDHSQYALQSGRIGQTLYTDGIVPYSTGRVIIADVYMSTDIGDPDAFNITRGNITLSVTTPVNLDQNVAEGSQVRFKSLTLNTTPSQPALDYYQYEEDTNFLMGFAFPITPTAIYYLKIGRCVTVMLKTLFLLNSANSIIMSLNQIPIIYRPIMDAVSVGWGKNAYDDRKAGTTRTNITGYIRTTGYVEINARVLNTFSGEGECGYYSMVFNYYSAT